MKKNILIAILVATNVFTGAWLLQVSWLKMLWNLEATSLSEFAAALWAANDYSKGKLVKLRLKIEEEPLGHLSKPTEFDGVFVVREHIGYINPVPTLGAQESPSIEVTRIMVDAYNRKMQEFHANPGEYKRQVAKEIECWQESVLGNKGRPNK